MNKNKKELISKIGVKKYQQIADLIDDLGWDYQSMTTSGRETYQKLCLAFGWKFDWDWETNWTDIVDIKKSKTAICCSVGWLINENSTTTVVMADFSFEDNGDIKQGGGYTTIPTKNVLAIKKIKI